MRGMDVRIGVMLNRILPGWSPCPDMSTRMYVGGIIMVIEPKRYTVGIERHSGCGDGMGNEATAGGRIWRIG